MRKFLISISFIIVSLFVIDRVAGKVLLYFTEHTHAHAETKLTHLLNESNEDIILMGTSRCDNHYVPSIISKKTGMTVYNAGISSSENIYSHYIVLNYLLSHHKPKVICLDVWEKDFNHQKNSFTFTSFFAPYYGVSEASDSVFEMAGNASLYGISHIYRFNSKFFETLYGVLVNHQYSNDNGYYANPWPSKKLSILNSNNTYSCSVEKMNYLQRFIDKCKVNNITLILVISPSLTNITSDLYDPIRKIAIKNGLPLLDYHSKKLFFDHPEYFSNNIHLWDKGARLFSSVFADDLNHILKNK